MTIRALRILPPLVIGRLGGAPEPVVNYTLEDDPNNPLGFRRLVAQPTFQVDPDSGVISSAYLPDRVDFTSGPLIRPVAPFLEVFAETSDDRLEPLTIGLLAAHGLTPADVQWRGRFANRKVVRRTTDESDAVLADTGWFTDHALQSLSGCCANFITPEARIEFGGVRYIAPTEAFPEIRLRFTPAKGLIYGPAAVVDDPDSAGIVAPIPEDRRIYDPAKGWYKYEIPVAIDNDDPDYTGPFANETLPASLFAIVPPAPSWLHGNTAISRGYLDDACDGIVDVALTLANGTRLEASARVTSGPPAIVPDSLFVRTLADDLEQALLGPAIGSDVSDDVIRQQAEDIVRRAHETVRFLNVTVMNGNVVKGRPPLSLDTMPAEEAYDTERLERPIMKPGGVDTLAVMALHQQVYTALRAGTAPWFVRMLRQPADAGDFTDAGRRRMPALMCGADNNYLALTHRQIDTIRAAAEAAPFMDTRPAAAGPVTTTPTLTPRNLSAQLHYRAAGNPQSTHIAQSVANCTPGLEVDMRAAWRRLFEGITLREYDNLVVAVDADVSDPRVQALAGHRLLRVNGIPMQTVKYGPSPADPDDRVVLSTEDNPGGIAPLEWSNALAHVLAQCAGKSATCDFSTEPVWLHQVPIADTGMKFLTLDLAVRPFFTPGTVTISETLAIPGELTQGLCSPWQNDYRECSCYYWASARPDYVNVQTGQDGASQGDNWLQKERTGEYVPDDYADSRLILYDDLFEGWERLLRFQVRGRDLQGDGVPVEPPATPPLLVERPARDAARDAATDTATDTATNTATT